MIGSEPVGYLAEASVIRHHSTAIDRRARPSSERIFALQFGRDRQLQPDVYHWHESLPGGPVNKFAAWASIYGFFFSLAGFAASAYAATGTRQLRDRIEELCAGPYLELFARPARPGWSACRNEVKKFDLMATAAGAA
jgi:hypothetical protein